MNDIIIILLKNFSAQIYKQMQTWEWLLNPKLTEKVQKSLFFHRCFLTALLKFHRTEAEAYLQASQISRMELFSENSSRLNVVNCFRQKAPS